MTTSRPLSRIAGETTGSLLAQREHARRDPELMQAIILSAARDEFVEHGLAGARVDRIAGRAEVGKNLIYYYYGDKEKLYLAVLEDIYLSMRIEQDDASILEMDPVAGMRRLVERTFDHFVHTPALTRLMSVENIYYAKHLRSSKIVRGLYEPLFNNLKTLLEKAQAIRQFRTDVDPIDLYITISAVSYFYLSNRHTLSWILDTDLASAERLRKRRTHVVDVVLGYLRPEPDGKTPA